MNVSALIAGIILIALGGLSEFVISNEAAAYITAAVFGGIGGIIVGRQIALWYLR